MSEIEKNREREREKKVKKKQRKWGKNDKKTKMAKQMKICQIL